MTFLASEVVFLLLQQFLVVLIGVLDSLGLKLHIHFTDRIGDGSFFLLS